MGQDKGACLFSAVTLRLREHRAYAKVLNAIDHMVEAASGGAKLPASEAEGGLRTIS
jgi:hypothetical protein